MSKIRRLSGDGGSVNRAEATCFLEDEVSQKRHRERKQDTGADGGDELNGESVMGDLGPAAEAYRHQQIQRKQLKKLNQVK